MQKDYTDVIEILGKYEQKEIIEIFNKLNDEQKENLANQIMNMDFAEIAELSTYLNKKEFLNSINVEPIKYIDKAKLEQNKKDEYTKIGEDIIKAGKFAVVTMAGGQGSRLGHNGPKGTFVVNIEPQPKAIFEILCDKLKRAKSEYNVEIPWYIMTSTENNCETKNFFEKNNYFGYSKEKVKFFSQGDIAVINESGKLLIDENAEIKKAGNGNGGIFKALKKENILEQMKNDGIEWVFVSGVDNILVNMVDSLFLGLTVENNTLIASKATTKVDPNEKVGVFCKKNGKTGIIEYIEISDELRNLRDENGTLVYSQVNIVSHLFSIKALEILANAKLPYHVAHKKGSYLNQNIELIKPEQPNMYKFEKFIFDGFEQFEDMTILSVKREDEFAPIKNAEGKDSPITARELYNAKQKESI